MELLAEDVTLWSDGGGKVQAARNPIHGADAVSRFLLGIMRKAPADLRVEPAVLNGEQGLVAYTGGRVFGALVLETDGARIHGVRFIVNPDKLTRLQRS
jgi:RNA polymerase sigma-70 factor, ECF subfamily